VTRPGEPGTSSTRPRILIVDDHVPTLVRVARRLEGEFEVAARLSDAESLLREWEALAPDAIVLDVSLRGESGLAAAERLRLSGCEAPVVFLSVHEEPEIVRAAWAAGGSAYVAKRDLDSELVPAIWAALEGRRFVSSAVNGT
jgi:DNA-binding NarL/FixJ family response regulator